MHDFAELLFGLGILINSILAGLTYLRAIKSSKDMTLLEKNTNSIKDALIKVTGEAEHAKGIIVGIAQEKEKFRKD